MVTDLRVVLANDIKLVTISELVTIYRAGNNFREMVTPDVFPIFAQLTRNKP